MHGNSNIKNTAPITKLKRWFF